mmetsp:Transcript_51045/g.148175  ORF Transcript_51045/g.148175 Transcript_51045/m.148175 type:complete len:296 (-) Transcript_51045:477-1364(-)
MLKRDLPLQAGDGPEGRVRAVELHQGVGLAIARPNNLAPRDLVLHLNELREPVARHVLREPLDVDVVRGAGRRLLRLGHRRRPALLLPHIIHSCLLRPLRLILRSLEKSRELPSGPREGLCHARQAHQPTPFLAGRRSGGRRRPRCAAAPTGVVPREDEVVAARADPVPGHHGLCRWGGNHTAATHVSRVGRAATLALQIPRELEVMAIWAKPVTRTGCRVPTTCALAARGARAAQVAHEHGEDAPCDHGVGVGRHALPAVRVPRKDEVATLGTCPVARLLHELLRRGQALLQGL